MADFIYPVNDLSDSWGGPPVKQYFRTTPRADGWYLAKCFNLIEPGDRIWAYATAPLQQIVGVGYVVDGPYWLEWDDGVFSDFLIDIEWDMPRNKKLVDIGPAHMFDRRSVPRTVRRAKPHEVALFEQAHEEAGE